MKPLIEIDTTDPVERAFAERLLAVQQVPRFVCDQYDLPLDKVMGSGSAREGRLSECRKVCWYILNRRYRINYPELATMWNYNPSSVRTGINTLKNWMNVYYGIRRWVNQIIEDYENYEQTRLRVRPRDEREGSDPVPAGRARVPGREGVYCKRQKMDRPALRAGTPWPQAEIRTKTKGTEKEVLS